MQMPPTTLSSCEKIEQTYTRFGFGTETKDLTNCSSTSWYAIRLLNEHSVVGSSNLISSVLTCHISALTDVETETKKKGCDDSVERVVRKRRTGGTILTRD